MLIKLVRLQRLGPLLTPPSVADPSRGTKGTFTFPGSGGANWEGGAVDPKTGYLYVGSATRTDSAIYGLTTPRPGQTDMKMIGIGGVAPSLQGLPVMKPPYGRITAIDLNRGEIAQSRAGVLATKTLLFAGEGYGGQPMFRAYDKKTGAILWEIKIPAGVQTGLPMTYMHRGKQYIVFAAAGEPSTQTAAQVVAFAIPDPPRAAPPPADADR